MTFQQYSMSEMIYCERTFLRGYQFSWFC